MRHFSVRCYRKIRDFYISYANFRAGPLQGYKQIDNMQYFIRISAILCSDYTKIQVLDIEVFKYGCEFTEHFKIRYLFGEKPFVIIEHRYIIRIVKSLCQLHPKTY